jgi:hypothetical protein
VPDRLADLLDKGGGDFINQMQRTGLNYDFPEDVIFLNDLHDTARLAEDILDDFSSSFYILTVFH